MQLLSSSSITPCSTQDHEAKKTCQGTRSNAADRKRFHGENGARIDVSLCKLIDEHAAALRATAETVQASNEGTSVSDRTSAALAVARLTAKRIEDAARLEVVNFVADSHQEANMKLTYMVAYLIATGSTLSAHEMEAVLKFAHGQGKG